MKGVKQIFDFEDHFFKLASEKSNELLKGSGEIVESELVSGEYFPVSIKSDFGVLIGEVHALNKAQGFVENLVLEIRQDFKKLLKSKSFEGFIGNFTDLVDVKELNNLPDVARDVIHMQVGLVLSFGAVIKNYNDLDINRYGDSFNQYFFSKKGYETVSSDLVVRPKLPKSSDQSDLKIIIGNQINAERYLRDMTRIIVETGGDGLYNTRNRYGQLKEKYGQDDAKKKLVEWFDSFGDMAEASLLPVVEEVLNGAFGVELNPLIAAAVGTFCSVTARKATEHSYLTLLGIS